MPSFILKHLNLISEFNDDNWYYEKQLFDPDLHLIIRFSNWDELGVKYYKQFWDQITIDNPDFVQEYPKPGKSFKQTLILFPRSGVKRKIRIAL